MLIVVTGPPAAGKSAWVMANAGARDIVVDYDRLAVALAGPGADSHDHHPVLKAVTAAARRAVIREAQRHLGRVDVYLIHSMPRPADLVAYQAQGARIEVVDPGRAVVLERCEQMRAPELVAVAERWYARHSGAVRPQHSRDW